ncbi:MAG: hypothetical protein E7Z92_03880 [Cyanobacteria bacterium SIG31]|nr:hypothetical protein [Cyanobacteria bacterium SIG31]
MFSKNYLISTNILIVYLFFIVGANLMDIGLGYGPYALLRLFVTAYAVWSVYILNDKKEDSKSFVAFVIIALLFNPIFKIYLAKGLWTFIDIILLIYLFHWRNSVIKD